MSRFNWPAKVAVVVLSALALFCVCGLIGERLSPRTITRDVRAIKIDYTSLHRNIAATVRIRVGDGSGTGVVVAPHTILTAAHVVCDAVNGSPAVDVFSDTGYLTHRGTVIAYNETYDLALVTVAADLPEPVVLGLGLCADLRAGAFCAAIGATAGHTPHNVTMGSFSSKQVDDVTLVRKNGQPYARPGLWQVSCSGFPGNSGCGVYCEGQLIGICISGDSPCTMFIIPVTEVAEYLAKEKVK